MTFNDFMWQVRLHFVNLLTLSKLTADITAPTTSLDNISFQHHVPGSLYLLLHDHGVYPPLHVCGRHQRYQILGWRLPSRNCHDWVLESHHCLAQGEETVPFCICYLDKSTYSSSSHGDSSVHGHCWMVSTRLKTWYGVWRTTTRHLDSGGAGIGVIICG